MYSSLSKVAGVLGRLSFDPLPGWVSGHRLAGKRFVHQPLPLACHLQANEPTVTRIHERCCRG